MVWKLMISEVRANYCGLGLKGEVQGFRFLAHFPATASTFAAASQVSGFTSRVSTFGVGRERWVRV
jgi:hypothetical protein